MLPQNRLHYAEIGIVQMIGEPGCGKTMIAQRIPTILPEMTAEMKIDLVIWHLSVFIIISRKNIEYSVIFVIM